jgi:hypothetical protein
LFFFFNFEIKLLLERKLKEKIELLSDVRNSWIKSRKIKIRKDIGRIGKLEIQIIFRCQRKIIRRN